MKETLKLGCEAEKNDSGCLTVSKNRVTDRVSGIDPVTRFQY